MPLPDCIRLLEGDALRDAERIVTSIAPALHGGEGGRGAKLAECTRVVYNSGGFDGMFDDHLRGLARGAGAVGESRAFVSDSVTIGEAGRFGALEVDLLELADFVASVSWENEKDQYGEWTIPILDDWPKEAAEIAAPVFVDDWTITSTVGSWCWIDVLSMEDCKLTATSEFLSAYRAARPEVIFDPIAFLHSDGDLLISESRDGERVVSHTQLARDYFEPMYGVDGARRIWEIYAETAVAVNELTFLASWDAKEAAFRGVVDADTALRADLEALWDGSYRGDESALE